MSVKKSITGALYKMFVGVFNVLPFKRPIALALKAAGVDTNKYLSGVQYGFFQVDVDGNKFYLKYQFSLVEREIFWHGINSGWEREVTWIWVELAKQSNVIVDIGANTGIFTLLSCAVNKNAKVYSFEPGKNIFGKLKENVEKNNFPASLQKKGVSNKSGIQTFYDMDLDVHMSASLNFEKIEDLQDQQYLVKTEIETVTIDKFCTDNNIEKIDLLKIDVELHEPEVLEGYQQLIYKHKPIIFIEILKDNIAERIYQLIDFNQYEILHFADYKKLERLKEFVVQEKTYNYLLIPKEKLLMVEKWIAN